MGFLEVRSLEHQRFHTLMYHVYQVRDFELVGSSSCKFGVVQLNAPSVCNVVVRVVKLCSSPKCTYVE